MSQLNNYTLAPIDDERISEAAGVNSAAGSFGLSFGLAMAGGILLATLLARVHPPVEPSPVIPSAQQQQIADTFEDDAEVMSNTHSNPCSPTSPRTSRTRSSRSTTRRATCPSGRAARADPRGLLGLLNAFRMTRLPDIEPSASVEAAALG